MHTRSARALGQLITLAGATGLALLGVWLLVSTPARSGGSIAGALFVGLAVALVVRLAYMVGRREGWDDGYRAAVRDHFTQPASLTADNPHAVPFEVSRG